MKGLAPWSTKAACCSSETSSALNAEWTPGVEAGSGRQGGGSRGTKSINEPAGNAAEESWLAELSSCGTGEAVVGRSGGTAACSGPVPAAAARIALIREAKFPTLLSSSSGVRGRGSQFLIVFKSGVMNGMSAQLHTLVLKLNASSCDAFGPEGIAVGSPYGIGSWMP